MENSKNNFPTFSKWHNEPPKSGLKRAGSIMGALFILIYGIVFWGYLLFPLLPHSTCSSVIYEFSKKGSLEYFICHNADFFLFPVLIVIPILIIAFLYLWFKKTWNRDLPFSFYLLSIAIPLAVFLWDISH